MNEEEMTERLIKHFFEISKLIDENDEPERKIELNYCLVELFKAIHIAI